MDLARQKAKPELANMDISHSLVKPVGHLPKQQEQQVSNAMYVPHQQQVVQQPVQYVPATDPFDGDPVKRILYGSGYPPTTHAMPREDYASMMAQAQQQQMLQAQQQQVMQAQQQLAAMQNNPNMGGFSNMGGYNSVVGMPNNPINPNFNNQFVMQQQPVAMGVNTLGNPGNTPYNMGGYGNNGMGQQPVQYNTPYNYR